MTGWIEALLARPARVAAAALVLAAAALPGLLRLEIDNSPASFYLEGTPERARFERFEEIFGPSATLRVVVSGAELWSPAGLAFVERLERECARLERVAAVASPFASFRRLHPGGSVAVTDPGALRVPSDPAALRSAWSDDPLFRRLGFVGRETGGEGPALSLLLAVDPGDAPTRRALLDELGALARAAPAGVAAEIVGLPVLDRALDDAARAVLVRLVPLLALVSFLLLFAVFRDLRALAAPFGFVLFAGALVFGAMGWVGVKLDLVVAVLPPVLLSIALAQAVHLLLRARDLSGQAREARPNRDTGDAQAAVVATYREKGRAIFWTTLSTIAGFGSLALSPVGPIRQLGLWGALAMLAIGATSFVFYPSLLAFALAPGRRERDAIPPGRRARRGRQEDAPERALERRLERFGRAVAGRAARHRAVVLAVYAALAFVAAVGLFRLSVESNALEYFPVTNPLRRSFAAAEAQGLPVAAIELVGEARADASFARGSALAALARLADELEKIPGVVAAVGATSFLDSAARLARDTPLARAFPPDELRARLLPLLRADAEGGRALANFLAADDRTARLTLFVPIGGFETIDPIAEAAEAAARRAAPAAEWHATGQLPLLLATQHRLLDTLATSLAFSVPAIALVFFFLLGSVKRAAAALVPNAWPVLVILGAMGWFGVPVDIATVMVASIVAGLVVDDTIHTLAPYRELARRLGARAAVQERLEKTAPAFVLTSAVLASGFAVCALSDFLPVARFGVLSVVAIAIALAADLFLVPALFGGERDAPRA